MAAVSLIAFSDVPDIKPGDDLAGIVGEVARRNGTAIESGDIVVLAQKIVSKVEDRYVDLRSIDPSPKAIGLAEICRKDPRLVELILRESVEVLRCIPGVIIVRHRLGLVLANAGIDQSNLPGNGANDRALLLPSDPDASAENLRAALAGNNGRDVGVAIIDSLGRAWRNGTVGTCIGAAGFEPVSDLRGSSDRYGRILNSSIVGAGDELAAAASMVMGQAAEGRPIVLVKGHTLRMRQGSASELVRKVEEDLFP